MKLTKSEIDKITPPEKGQAFFWDDEIKGFGLRITPNTSTFILQARVKGKSRRVSLGKPSVISLHEARRRAIKKLAEMSDGIDPAKEKKKHQVQAVTLRDAVAAYLKDRVKHKGMKFNSQRDVEKHMARSFQDWADMPLIEIDREMVKARFGLLTDKGPTQANQAMRILRAIFNYAIENYRIENKPAISENPVNVISGLKLWNPKKAKDGKIPMEKIGAAWSFLQGLRLSQTQTHIARTCTDAACFLLLTGCRFSEMATLTWENIDLENGAWHIPDPKNREPVTFPLSAMAMDILVKRPKVAAYVFPGRGNSGAVTEIRGILGKMVESINSPRVTAHDLRRTFRAVAFEAGVDFVSTKLLMGHKFSGDVTIKHYSEKQNLLYLRPAIEKISQWIEHQAAIHKAGNVVDIKSRKPVANG
ncbi:MAG: tyrosine-type recombinase/integrase [Thermodesulfobacteriota bacterium]